MKKRIFSLFLAGMMAFTTLFATGCNSETDSNSSESEVTTEEANNTTTSDVSDTATNETDDTWDILKDAYIYAFPLLLEYATMEKMTNTVEPTSTQAPANQFIHARSLATADFTDVVTPNVDTIYSQVWLDLKDDAVVIEKPATDRYCSIEVLDAYSNCVTILGTGGDTNDAQTYLFTGPDFEGDVPEGMTQIDIPTNMGWVLVRTICNGTDDEDNVHAIQDAMSSCTLTQYNDGTEPVEGTYEEGKDYTPVNYVLSLSAEEYFTLANNLMVDNPPADEDADVMTTFAQINVGPGLTFDSDILGTNASENWTTMLSSLRSELSSDAMQYVLQNGVWSCYGSPIAEFGTEYNYRALVALVGFGANPVSMAMYMRASVDSEGNELSGEHSYILHFDADQIPPVEEDGFWSITVYDNENDALIDNALDRYCINDRSDVQYNDDGSLDILIQASAVDADNTSNWLPVNDEEFHLMLRVYLPSEDVQNGTWVAPTITCVD